MSTYTTNTKPESKFEDVPEEVLTDPTMRTALGMDPIPGMNTPVDDNKEPWTNGMKVFKHPQFGNLTVIQKEDNELWFIGKEVAEKLGYKDAPKAVKAHVDTDDKGVGVLPTPGGTQKMTIINESGLYSLILSSKLPSAKEFKHWVTSEVLPSIRKNGAYIRNQENMTPEQLVAAGLIAAQKIIESKEKEIALLNGRCGLLTQAVDEKQNIIDAISRNVSGETKRMLMNRFLRSKYPELSQGRYGYLYTVFGEVYHMNLKYRFEKYNKEPGHKKCKSMMEYIDEVLGMIDELFDLFVKLYASSFKEFLQSIYVTRMTDEEFESEEYWKRVL